SDLAYTAAQRVRVALVGTISLAVEPAGALGIARRRPQRCLDGHADCAGGRGYGRATERFDEGRVSGGGCRAIRCSAVVTCDPPTPSLPHLVNHVISDSDPRWAGQVSGADVRSAAAVRGPAPPARLECTAAAGVAGWAGVWGGGCAGLRAFLGRLGHLAELQR